MKKLFTLSATVAVALSVTAADNVSVNWADTEEFFTATAISPNSSWVCGRQSIWNIETGEIINIGNEEAGLGAVADNGTAVGSMGDFAIMADANGKLSFFDDLTFTQYSTARGITADGSIITGSRFDEALHQTPCYWKNGVYYELPVPDVMEDIPAEVEIYSVAAGKISADGSVIIGNIITGTSAEAFVMWTRNEAGEYEFHPLYAGLMEFGWELEKPYVQISAQNISPNGKWISVLLQLNDFDDLTYYPGRYNVETGVIECADFPEDNLAYWTGDYYVTGISNQGTAVGFVEQEYMLMYGRQSFIWPADSEMTELLSTYCDGNMEVSDLEDSQALVYTAISGDAERVVGFAVLDGWTESFVVNLGSGPSAVETVGTEAKGVNTIYDMQGRPVSGKPAPGLYIITEDGNTRKVLVK